MHVYCTASDALHRERFKALYGTQLMPQKRPRGQPVEEGGFSLAPPSWPCPPGWLGPRPLWEGCRGNLREAFALLLPPGTQTRTRPETCFPLGPAPPTTSLLKGASPSHPPRSTPHRNANGLDSATYSFSLPPQNNQQTFQQFKAAAQTVGKGPGWGE